MVQITTVFTIAYAYNQNTGYVLGLEVYSGQTTTGSVYSLKSAYAPVTGAETAEFYIKMKLDYITGDKTTTNGPMFSYDIRVDQYIIALKVIYIIIDDF